MSSVPISEPNEKELYSQEDNLFLIKLLLYFFNYNGLPIPKELVPSSKSLEFRSPDKDNVT